MAWVKESIKEWSPALIISLGLILFEITCLVLAIWNTPEGYVWLGDLIFNATDYPVYLNYLGQTKTSLLVINLYKVLPQVPYLEPYWSILGQLCRFNIPPIWVHEISRWANTIILSFVVYWIAKSSTNSKKHALFASLAMVSGMGSGWIFAFIFNLWHGYFLTSLPIDVSTEFSLVTTLSGGSHMILSLALEMLCAFVVWRILVNDERKLLWIAIPAVFALASFHPYYIPLIGLVSLCTLIYSLRDASGRLRKTIDFIFINICQLPGFTYFAWLSLSDKAIGNQYLNVNRLPLSSYGLWLLALVPFAIATVALVMKPESFNKFVRSSPAWAWAWLGSALICMLLPFPWTQKYTQGLSLALVAVTLPFWIWCFERIYSSDRFWRQMVFTIFASGTFMYFLFLYPELPTPELRSYFYQPKSVLDAWSYIRLHSGADDITLMDDERLNLWSPAYTLRRTWLGHAHATPVYYDKLSNLTAWRATQDKGAFNKFLLDNRIGWILSSNRITQDKYGSLVDEAWERAFSEDGVVVWRKR